MKKIFPFLLSLVLVLSSCSTSTPDLSSKESGCSSVTQETFPPSLDEAFTTSLADVDPAPVSSNWEAINRACELLSITMDIFVVSESYRSGYTSGDYSIYSPSESEDSFDVAYSKILYTEINGFSFPIYERSRFITLGKDGTVISDTLFPEIELYSRDEIEKLTEAFVHYGDIKAKDDVKINSPEEAVDYILSAMELPPQLLKTSFWNSSYKFLLEYYCVDSGPTDEVPCRGYYCICFTLYSEKSDINGEKYFEITLLWDESQSFFVDTGSSGLRTYCMSDSDFANYAVYSDGRIELLSTQHSILYG